MSASKKYILITGANRGIGFATTKALASQNTHIIMAVRDVQRGEEAAKKLRTEIPAASLEVMLLDLASLASVRSFAEFYTAKDYPLHVLINNAAPLSIGKDIQYTQDGFELRFGVNHLGHFLLTILLLPKLKASAPSRIITVSSIRHRQAKTFDFDNLQGEKSYDEGAFYNHTKLANLLFTYELQRRLEKLRSDFQLSMITNRGVKVYPDGLKRFALTTGDVGF
jgi:NAD(P)-dependent dehydrogenase (short-subunit alcohol dehydrogenase family)